MEKSGNARFRSKAERREIVEETLKPGASVSRVARAHNVNANQVFNWRKLYRSGHLEVEGAVSAFDSGPDRIDTQDLVRN